MTLNKKPMYAEDPYSMVKEVKVGA